METVSRTEEGKFLTLIMSALLPKTFFFRNSRATAMASCIIELKKGDVVSIEKIQAATPHNENANYFEGHLIQETHHYDL